MVSIISVHIGKGGTGKSTFTHNFAKNLEMRKKRTLVIDGDFSMNVTFNILALIDETVAEEETPYTVYDIFSKSAKELLEPDVRMIRKINKYISLIPGSASLNDKQIDLKSKMQGYLMLLFSWVRTNIDYLNENFDYIIIDTHNDNSDITKNFLAISDIIVCPVDPSINSLRSWYTLLEMLEDLKSQTIDIMTRQSYVVAEPYLVVSRLHNTKIDKQFLENAMEIEQYIGYIPERDSLHQSMTRNIDFFTLFESLPPSKQKDQKDIKQLLETIMDKIIEKAESED